MENNTYDSISDSKSNLSDVRRFAVVTGASSGIGLALAREFATNGYDLLVVADSAKIETAAAELRSLGAAVEALQVDLAQYAGVERLAERISTSPRALDAIAINAGVGVGGDFARETDLEDELNLIRLNVISVVHLTKRVVKSMIERGAGKILFTSSVVSQMPGPFQACYAASKAFVQSFADAIRNELRGTGIQITTLLPGATETNFFHRADLDDTKVGQAKKDDPADVARDGFRALMDGDDRVVGGSFMNKVQVAASQVLPEGLKAELHRKMSEPGSGSTGKKSS